MLCSTKNKNYVNFRKKKQSYSGKLKLSKENAIGMLLDMAEGVVLAFWNKGMGVSGGN